MQLNNPFAVNQAIRLGKTVGVLCLSGAWLIAGVASAADPDPGPSADTITVDTGALAGVRHRVLVSTDIGGTDPDDFQSLVHLLLYADVLDIEGLVSSPYGPGRREHIHQVIDCYERDYPNLREHAESYPRPAALRVITKQGETEVAPYHGVRRSTEGSDWIVTCARRDDSRPLAVLVWGGLEDLAQALHDAPDIRARLRVYWIGGPNKKWSPDAYQYIVTHHPDLWIIESNSTYRGWFNGGNQSGAWGNREFTRQHIAARGALGEFFGTQLGGTIKMGDTPSVAWLLRGHVEDPAQPGWGGAYVRAWKRPYLRLDRLPTPEDRMEVFGILELVLPLDPTASANPEARLLVENQSLAGHTPGDGSMRFRFSPKAAKAYTFKIEGTVPSVDGKTGGITAVLPSQSVARQPAAAHPHWWTDNPARDVAEGEHLGAKTVNRWREDFLRSFSQRTHRCLATMNP